MTKNNKNHILKAAIVIAISLAFIMPGAAVITNIENTTQNSFSDTITVDDDGGADYTKIQDAINASSNGDEIFIYEGIYFESLLVDKEVSLVGESRDGVIIDCPQDQDHMEVTASNVALEALSFIKSMITLQGDGVVFAGVSDISINNCYFNYLSMADDLLTFDGELVGCDHIVVQNSDFYRTGNSKFAIYGKNLTDISIINCNFTRAFGGIDIKTGADATIQDCYFECTYFGITLGSDDGVSDFPVEYFDIIRCEIKPYSSSMLLGSSFIGNNVDIIGCSITGCVVAGIAFRGSRNQVVNSCIENSFHGVEITGGTLNTFHHNDFIDNTKQFYIPPGLMTRNTWDDGYEGNHWSHYDEPSEGAWDNDTDGRIDEPLVFDNYNADNFPLVAWKPAPPQITVLYPNGEELVGGIVNIAWDQTIDIFGEPVVGAEISIDYNVDGGSWEPIASGLEDTGSYNWDTTAFDLEDSNGYMIRIGSTYDGVTGYDTSDEEFALDSTDPIVTITNPLEGEIYLFGTKLSFQIPSTKVFVLFGPVTIVANAVDDMSGIDHVLFELDSGESFDDYDAAYSWILNEKIIGKRTLTVTAYNNVGLSTEQQMDILIINPFGG